MIWIILFGILTAAVFVVVYTISGAIWTATNCAGIVAVIFLVGLVIRTARIFDRRWQRITVTALGAVMIAGLVTHWIISWRTTEWQRAQLLTIRRVIYNGEVMTSLEKPAYDTFREYRRSPSGQTMSQIFRTLHPPGMPLIDSVIEAEAGPVFTDADDNTVVLTEEATFVPGFDSAFINYDGRHGLAQIQMRITPEGAHYDIQN